MDTPRGRPNYSLGSSLFRPIRIRVSLSYAKWVTTLCLSMCRMVAETIPDKVTLLGPQGKWQETRHRVL